MQNIRSFERVMYSPAEQAVVSFLAQYRGETLKLYNTHLKIFYEWCEENAIEPLEATRTDLDMFRYYLETVRKNASGTVSSRLICVRTFYKFCVEEEVTTTFLGLATSLQQKCKKRWIAEYNIAKKG